MNLLTIKKKIAKFGKVPGVYIFKSKNGVILYIGKAANLRSRVGSYFSDLKRFDLSQPKRTKEV